MKQLLSQTFKWRTRILSLVLFAWAFIGPVGNLSAKSRGVKAKPVIRVGIYNYTEIHRSTLREAERHAGELFAMAGVRIEWVEHLHKATSAWTPPDDPRPDFSVRILFAATMWRIPKNNALGESIIPAGMQGPLKGGIANVYYDRVREVSSEWGPFTTGVLGDAIAHELGHLLLGPRHSRKGIMKAVWTLQDREPASKCELRFSREQVAALQRAVRSLHQASSSTVLAKR